MEDLIKWYENDGEKMHPVERASLLHILFVGIHPFIDGNGRTSRLLLNFELMKNGYPPIVIRNKNRIECYKVLDKAHTTGDYKDFFKLIVNELNRSLGLYLKLI